MTASGDVSFARMTPVVTELVLKWAIPTMRFIRVLRAAHTSSCVSLSTKLWRCAR